MHKKYRRHDSGCVICDSGRGNRTYVGEIDFEIQAMTFGTVEVAFIFLTFRVGIVESYQDV